MKTISVHDLTKIFGRLAAVDHISFSVEQGEAFGFLGPNGAGKTTIMMMLATALNPTSGNAIVCGYDISKDKDRVRENISFIFQELSLDINLTARENLDFHARMYHLPEKTRKERISQVLDVVGLEDKQDMLVKHYSGGMQRRLEIARGMLTHPKVLFLDEPTLGLDVQTRRLLWNYARELNKEMGTTILLNTHYVEEADYLCDRVAILNHGRIVVTESPEKLKDSVGEGLLRLKLINDPSENFIKMLREESWVRKINQQENWLELRIGNGSNRIPEVVRLARKQGIIIASISQRKPSLEDVFIHYVGGGLKDSQHG